jgi:hypothetical protein
VKVTLSTTGSIKASAGELLGTGSSEESEAGVDGVLGSELSPTVRTVD